MSSETSLPPGARNQTEVYAVHGADPEVLAYAMAKYSRSALSMRESLTEISAQRAEQFLNTFYFQYGHRSIADLAHIAFAVERLCLLAAIVLVDEQRWDGQERSTRYQNFLKSGWYLPDFGADSASAQLYSQTITNLFAAYQRTTAAVLEALRRRIPCPETLKPEAYERTLKARAFDVARYLLPLATNTSLGQIVNARTLETQVSRLLSHPLAEVRDLGVKLREAATGPAWNVNAQAGTRCTSSEASSAEHCPEIRGRLASEAANLFTREVRTAPTLVKYAEPSEYLIQTRAELASGRGRTSRRPPHRRSPRGRPRRAHRNPRSRTRRHAALLRQPPPLPPDPRPGRRASPKPASPRSSSWASAIAARHDEALRAFHAGAALRFDILMDIGGFRDMHRHRRCTQIIQAFTAAPRLRIPDCGDLGPGVNILAEAGILADFQSAIDSRSRRQRPNRRRLRARGRPVRPLSAPPRHPHPLPLQDGLRRSPVHLRATLRARRPLQLPPRSLGDVQGPRTPAPHPRQTHPRHRLHPAHRPPPALTDRLPSASSRCTPPGGGMRVFMVKIALSERHIPKYLPLSTPSQAKLPQQPASVFSV